MKKLSLLTSSLVTIVLSLFVLCSEGKAQHEKYIIVTEPSQSVKKSQSPVKPFGLYFTSYKADSSIFSSDTMILSKTVINEQFPRLIFTPDSSFSFKYNVVLKNTEKVNAEDNMASIMTIESSNKIAGVWKSKDIKKDIRLILKNNLSVNYTIQEDKQFVYLIKF